MFARVATFEGGNAAEIDGTIEQMRAGWTARRRARNRVPPARRPRQRQDARRHAVRDRGRPERGERDAGGDEPAHGSPGQPHVRRDVRGAAPDELGSPARAPRQGARTHTGATRARAPRGAARRRAPRRRASGAPRAALRGAPARRARRRARSPRGRPARARGADRRPRRGAATSAGARRGARPRRAAPPAPRAARARRAPQRPSQCSPSPSQQPILNRHRGHCQVWWRHSIGALQRRQRSTVGSGFFVTRGCSRPAPRRGGGSSPRRTPRAASGAWPAASAASRRWG